MAHLFPQPCYATIRTMPAGRRPTPATRQTKLIFSGLHGSVPWNNVMWLYLTGSGEITVPELDDLASACATAYTDNLLQFFGTITSFDRCQIVLYSAGDAFEGTANGGGAGPRVEGNSSKFHSSQVATCISWAIAPHYRGGHPRSYLPAGMTGDRTAPNQWSATFADGVSSAATAFHADLEAISGVSSGITTVEHGVVSFVRDGAWRNPPVFYRIAAAHVDRRVDTQRRRLGQDVS